MTPADDIRPRSRSSRDMDWEAAWAPYDESVYGTALAMLDPEDVVYDIGAGDLRFAVRVAQKVRKVVAVERNPAILRLADLRHGALPANLEVVCADALGHPVPEGTTVGVLLMRHCRHFRDYFARLRASGCGRLVTNARWGMGVECVPLSPQPRYAESPAGWYGCACGAVGLKASSPEAISEETLNRSVSVEDCPACGPDAAPPRSST